MRTDFICCSPFEYIILVESKEKGLYKRRSKTITHTTKLVCDVRNSAKLSKDLNEYLKTIGVLKGDILSRYLLQIPIIPKLFSNGIKVV